MKKVVGLLLCGVLAVSAAACSPKKEVKTLTGTGKGFGGEITVTVTTEDGKITKVEAVGEKETQGIGSNAIKQLPAKIVEAGNTDVDTIAGATVSSKGILYAVNNALDPETYPWPIEESKKDVNEVVASDADMGFGVASSGRVGPGKDDQEVQVYSFNDVFVTTLFDENDKIAALMIDQLEVATPNYDGETMPHFSGYPGQSYNIDENHDGKVDGVTENTEDLFMSEIDGWKTKRERGDGYVMGTGYWYQQMDKYESIFVGMSVDEVEEWFAKYCSDLNGRPLQANASKDEDVKKYEALSQEEKDMLADVTSSATMSLQDGHGDILKAIRKSLENKHAIDLKIGQ